MGDGGGRQGCHAPCHSNQLFSFGWRPASAFVNFVTIIPSPMSLRTSESDFGEVFARELKETMENEVKDGPKGKGPLSGAFSGPEAG